MKRTFFAGLAALLLTAAAADAQCVGGSCGANVIPSAAGHQYGYPTHLGCGGFCFKRFGRLAMEGPLFNYGPYEGYYPFAPYGPWDSNLCYNGGGGGAGGCGAGGNCGWNPNLFHRRGGLGGGCGAGGCGNGFGGLGGIAGRLGGLGGFGGGGNCGAGGCGGGGYALNTFKGVFYRSHPLAHRAQISTGSSAAPVSGCGDCAGSLSAVSASAIQPVSAESPADPVYGDRVYRER